MNENNQGFVRNHRRSKTSFKVFGGDRHVRSATTGKEESFGQRLRRLRKAKGFTQTELAAAAGTSQPLIAHYERRDGVPGPILLLKISEAISVTPEELLGVSRPRRKSADESPENLRLWRKLRQVEKLSAAERRQVLQLIDALVERSELKRRSG